MVWSVTKGVASARPSGSTGSGLWESNEEDALGSVGRELHDLSAIRAIVYIKPIEFLTATAGSSSLPEQYTRALQQALKLHCSWTRLPQLRYKVSTGSGRLPSNQVQHDMA